MFMESRCVGSGERAEIGASLLVLKAFQVWKRDREKNRQNLDRLKNIEQKIYDQI